MGRWKLKDKHGKYRSLRAFKKDCENISAEEWEKKNFRVIMPKKIKGPKYKI